MLNNLFINSLQPKDTFAIGVIYPNSKEEIYGIGNQVSSKREILKV